MILACPDWRLSVWGRFLFSVLAILFTLFLDIGVLNHTTGRVTGLIFLTATA
jgi:hypothetical protein